VGAAATFKLQRQLRVVLVATREGQVSGQRRSEQALLLHVPARPVQRQRDPSRRIAQGAADPPARHARRVEVGEQG
jgi:hypothetical protein